MATEVSCGQCQGRLLVETLGVVVACPHCGTHLSIPAPEPAPAPAPQPTPPPAPEPPVLQFPAAAPEPVPAPTYTPAPVEVPTPAPEPVFTYEPPAPAASAPAADHHDVSVFAGIEEAAAPAPIGWHSTPNLHLSGDHAAIPDPAPQPVTPAATLLEPSVPASPPAFDAPFQINVAPVPAEAVVQMPMTAANELQLSSTQQFSLGAIQDVAAASTPAPPTSVTAPTPAPAPNPDPFTFGAASVPTPAPVTTPAPQPFSFGTAAAAPSAEAPQSFGAAPLDVEVATHAGRNTAEQDDGELAQRQKMLFMVLIAVGSYASCVTLVLIYMMIRGQASNLESLPDIVPPRSENGQIGVIYNPPKNDVAPGHVLTLGQTRRFGSLNVTPLKVTRGPVKFEHFSTEPGNSREPTRPLLKLWVKFENVSHNQKFAPLDPYLLFYRKSASLSDPVHANGFVATLANQRKGDPVSLVYEMSKESEFRMVGQNLSLQLEPGEKLETFIPAEEDATELTGDMVWRVQFRKGYNPRSKRGVTTLIDVRFNSSDIKDDRGA